MTDLETNDTPAAVAPQDATAAPEKAPRKKTTSRKKRLPQGPKKLARAKSHKAARKGQNARPAKPRPQSKGAQILDLIGRSKGATLAEIRKATGWQAHSVRGFISTAGKRHGVKIKSTKGESGERVYQITK